MSVGCLTLLLPGQLARRHTACCAFWQLRRGQIAGIVIQSPTSSECLDLRTLRSCDVIERRESSRTAARASTASRGSMANFCATRPHPAQMSTRKCCLHLGGLSALQNAFGPEIVFPARAVDGSMTARDCGSFCIASAVRSPRSIWTLHAAFPPRAQKMEQYQDLELCNTLGGQEISTPSLWWVLIRS